MSRAVVYARYSSDNQRDESISAQVRACEEFLKKMQTVLVKVYADEAKTATTDDRPNFQKMIEDIKSGTIQVDYVCVHKLDRFSRDKYDSAHYKRQLKRWGVRVISVLEYIDDSPEGVLLESVIEGLAHYYSLNLAREVMKGMKENAYQAKHTGGKPPLGYDINSEKKYVVNEWESQAVKLIFSMVDSGFGYDRIISELNIKGFKTKSGRPFTKNSLHDILKNEKYKGVYIFNRRQSRSVDGKKNNRRVKPDSEIIKIPDAIPAIIDKDLFERVQEKMQQRKQYSEKSRMKAKQVYLLTGLVECGKCGAIYIGNSFFNKKSPYSYYECGARDRKRTCDGRRIKKEFLEDLVVKEMEQTVFSPAGQRLLIEKLMAYKDQFSENRKLEKKYIEQEIKRIEGIIGNIISQVEEGIAPKSLVKQLETREVELEEYRTRLDEILSTDVEKIDEEKIGKYLKHLWSKMQKGKDDEKKAIVQEFVQKVVVYDDQIKVTFKVDLGLVPTGGGEPYHEKVTINIKHYRHSL